MDEPAQRDPRGRADGRGVALALIFAALAAPGGAFSAAPAPREAWRKTEAGRVTVVGTASDAKILETAVTMRGLALVLPGLVPGAFGRGPSLVVAVVHEREHLERVGLGAGGAPSRGVVAGTSEEESRPGLLRACVAALSREARPPLPGWLAEGLGEYLSTFAATEGQATLGRLVPGHLSRLRGLSLPPGRPALFAARAPFGEDVAGALLRAQAWAAVHLLLHGTADGERKLGTYLALLADERDAAAAFREAFGEGERAFLARASARLSGSRPLARPVTLPAGPPVGRLLPLTRAGAAAILGGSVRGRGEPVAAPGAARPAPARAPVSVSRDVPAEVDLVNRLVDEGREEEALARLEALHASLGGDPEMQRALGWDVQEVRRVVVHNRLVRRYNEAIGLLNAGRREEAVPIFREVAASAEDPALRRLAWERATAPPPGR